MEGKKPKRPKPMRLLGGKGSEVGVSRYRLYRSAHRRVRLAQENGYFFEAVTLCESMITDRIEARIQFLKKDEPQFHFIDNLGSRLSYWELIETTRDGEFTDLVSKLQEWTKERNAAVHQFVKVTAQCVNMSPEQRIEMASRCAEVGKTLVREVSAFVKRHNRWK